MAPEQNVNKSVKDVYKVEIFSLGVVMFKLLFKTFPFTTESLHEDARNPRFLEQFMDSERNIHRVRLSPECSELLKMMLAYNQDDRCTLMDVITSKWFNTCHWRLKLPDILDKTKKSLFQKLQYVVNLTSVKLEIGSLKNELTDKLRTQVKHAVSQVQLKNQEIVKNQQVTFSFPVYEPLKLPAFSSSLQHIAVAVHPHQQHQLKNLLDTPFKQEYQEPNKKDLLSLPPCNEVFDYGLHNQINMNHLKKSEDLQLKGFKKCQKLTDDESGGSRQSPSHICGGVD